LKINNFAHKLLLALDVTRLPAGRQVLTPRLPDGQGSPVEAEIT
jgi:hypothetical protein